MRQGFRSKIDRFPLLLDLISMAYLVIYIGYNVRFNNGYSQFASVCLSKCAPVLI